MKTRKLIELLNEADPTGEAEVLVGNTDIHHVDPMPCYYDGRAQIVEREDWKPTKLIVRASGQKVKIKTISFSDAIELCHGHHFPLPEFDFKEFYQEADQVRLKQNLLNVFDECEKIELHIEKMSMEECEKKFQVYVASGKVEDLEKEFGDYISALSGRSNHMRKFFELKKEEYNDWDLEGWLGDKLEIYEQNLKKFRESYPIK